MKVYIMEGTVTRVKALPIEQMLRAQKDKRIVLHENVANVLLGFVYLLAWLCICPVLQSVYVIRNVAYRKRRRREKKRIGTGARTGRKKKIGMVGNGQAPETSQGLQNRR